MEQILETIPTAWKDHITFAQWIVKRKNPEVIVDLGVDWGVFIILLCSS